MTTITVVFCFNYEVFEVIHYAPPFLPCLIFNLLFFADEKKQWPHAAKSEIPFLLDKV